MTKQEAKAKIKRKLLELKEQNVIGEVTFEIWSSLDEGHKFYKGYVFRPTEPTIDDTVRRIYVTEKDIRFQCSSFDIGLFKYGKWETIDVSELW